MNATDLGLWLHLRSARRTQTPAAPRPSAGPRPGEAVEAAPPARPVTVVPDHIVDHVLHLVDEHAGLVRQEQEYLDPNLANAQHARDLQAAYYAEIRDYLNGARR